RRRTERRALARQHDGPFQPAPAGGAGPPRREPRVRRLPPAGEPGCLPAGTLRRHCSRPDRDRSDRYPGSRLRGWERRALLVELVRSGLAEAVVFPRDGRALPPTEVLHRKPVVLAPGRFETVRPIHGRILAVTLEELRAEGTDRSPPPIGLFALTVDAPSEG